MGRAARWRGLCAVGLLSGTTQLGACGSCSDEPRVPFKLKTLEGGAARAEPEDSGIAPATYEVVPSEEEPRIDDQPLPIPFVRALMAYDLDDDGDRDGIALAHDAVQRMRLVISLREADGFREAADVASFVPPGEADCTLDAAEFQLLAKDKAALHITQRCGEDQVLTPPSSTLFTLEKTPRVHQRLALLPAPGEAPSLSIALGSEDADGDGHDDVVVSLSLEGAMGVSDTDAGEKRPRLLWLDRPGGLLRDPQEPDASFMALVEDADAQLRDRPEQALSKAQAVVDLYRAVCRESGSAQLRVSGEPGVVCQGSRAVARAFALLVKARARTRGVVATLDAYRELTAPALRAPSRLVQATKKVLMRLPTALGVSMRKGPSVTLRSTPSVHLPAARFVDEHSLVLQRSAPVLYALETGEETAVTVPTDNLMRDPSGALAVTAVERDCRGYVLRVERAPKLGLPFIAGRSVSTPLLAALASVDGCTSLPSHLRRDDGGYQVLGWAPQGIVAERGTEVRVVPLSIDGEPSGDPFVLPQDAPLPAPLPAGRATPDGAHYAELTEAGVLVVDRDRTAPSLWRPDGYAALVEHAREVAISPSGRRVAVVAQGDVYLLEKSP